MKKQIYKPMALSTLACFVSVLVCSTVFAGRSGGGGGGNVRDNYTIAMNPKKGGWIFADGAQSLIAGLKGASAKEKIARFIESTKDLTTQQCPDRTNMPIIPLPTLSSKFQILIEPKQSLLAKAFQRPLPAPVKADILSICASQDLYESYNIFALSLWSIQERKDHDGSAVYLINKTVESGGPISVIITSRVEKAVAVSGKEIEESIWYDDKTDSIYFSPLTQSCEHINCFSNRDESQVLTHDIGHSYLKRALGEKYPQLKEWHDVRYIGKINEDDGKSKFLNSQSSQEAAYIESLANTFEKRHYVTSHPFVVTDISLHSLHSDGCYNPTARGSEKIFESGTFQAPVDNEVYVSSVLNQFLTGYKTQNDVSEGNLDIEKYDRGYLLSSVNVKRQRTLIDAIANHKPTNIRQLMIAYDKQSRTDHGLRLLREYFFEDYATNQKIGGNYKVQKKASYITIGATDFSREVCGPKEDYQKSFSIALAEEFKENDLAARKEFARNVTSDSLLSDVQKNLEEFESYLSRIEAIMPLTLIDETYNVLMNDKAICSRSTNEFEHALYSAILAKHKTIVPIMPMMAILHKKCLNSTYANLDQRKLTWQQYLEKYQKTKALSFLLLESKTQPGTEEHFQKVTTWLQYKNELKNATYGLRDIVVTLSAAKDLPAQ